MFIIIEKFFIVIYIYLFLLNKIFSNFDNFFNIKFYSLQLKFTIYFDINF